MASSYTVNVGMNEPGPGDTNWNASLNANFTLLDGLAAVGGLCVSLKETPSASLNVAVAAGTFRNSAGAFAAYAGAATQGLTASATNSVYLTDSGALTVSTTGFPAGVPIVRLAVVVCGTSTVTSIADARVAYQSAGVTVSLPLAGGTMTDASAVAGINTGTTHGTQVATAAAQLLGFWGAAPVAQPSGASQAAVAALTVSTGGTASTTLAAAANTTAETDSTTGTASTTVADVGATYSQAGLNNIHASILARLAEQRTLNAVLINAVTSLGTQANANTTLINALRSALVAEGLIKGSA